MSGGCWDYKNDDLCGQLYGYEVRPSHGMRKFNKRVSASARKHGPFHDVVLDELLYDMFCLLHSLDWYNSGDTGIETLEDDMNFFKEKWLKSGCSKEYTKNLINEEFEDRKNELLKALMFEVDENGKAL